MTDILYQNGDYDVRRVDFYSSGTHGYGVFRNTTTAAFRVSSIGFDGDKGFSMAKTECDKRASNHAR